MTRHLTHSPAETEALGFTLGQGCPPGSVIGLAGDLGAGKTAFTRGFVRGVGSSARVHSPTFALLNEYLGGRCPVHHLDLYRLHSPDDIAGAGLLSYLLEPPGITVVEWIERWLPAAPLSAPIRIIRFRHHDETTREIVDESARP
jgi:tRNA threonylcarbamoyladenosine biosynthesis protein TsaE